MEKMNEHLYIAHKKLPHKTLRVHSARERERTQNVITQRQTNRERQRDKQRDRERQREKTRTRKL